MSPALLVATIVLRGAMVLDPHEQDDLVARPLGRLPVGGHAVAVARAQRTQVREMLGKWRDVLLLK